jgi:dTDP-4-amino-4,6-dideoxygalactose transaminase
VAQFEKQFREYVGASHALAVSSCTAALHLALHAAGIGPGDEVITTPLTFCATVNVILDAGATPVLCDIGKDLNLDPAAIVKHITPRTRAILPVHFGGLPCQMSAVWAIARRWGLLVFEDAAHAAGAFYCGTPIGAGRSDAVAFSFYATKNLTTGEGGMVTSNSVALYERMKVACLHGISRDAWNRYTEEGNWYYEVVSRGFKYNMSDLAAAVGIPQLHKLDRMNERRREIAHWYNDAFREMPQVELPPDRSDSRHAWHLYVLRLNLSGLSIDRGRFLLEMRSRGIGCSVHFIPIPLHAYFKKTLELRDPCRRTLAEFPRLTSLPIYSKMTDGDVERVIAAVQDVVKKYSMRRALAPGATRSAMTIEAGN